MGGLVGQIELQESGFSRFHQIQGCDIGGANELGLIYFPTNWEAKECQNLPKHGT